MIASRAAQIERIDNPDGLWEALVEALSHVGISHVIYLTVDKDFANPYLRSTLTSIYDDTPPELDPFLAHCCGSYEITRTGAEFSDEHDYLPPDAMALIRAAADEGFRSGMGIPMRLRGSERFGGFNLGTPQSREDFLYKTWPRAEELRLFCLLMHRRIEELTQATAVRPKADFRTPMIAPHGPAVQGVLSPREHEVVYLLAMGRSRKEVAHMCGISVHTVSDHAKLAYRKLGVSNRAQAANIILAGQDGAARPQV